MDPKNEELFTSVKKYQSDVVLLQELGNNWSAQSRKNSWRKRVETYLDKDRTRTRCSHNIHDPVRKRKQIGGTGVLTHGIMAHNSLGSGCDKSGLGRWTWARYRGKTGMTLRCVSFYRPAADNNGEESVGAQHTNYLRGKNDDRPSRKAFLEDLEEELTEWTESGDHVIIGGDINESIFSKTITDLLERHSLRSLIFERHNPSLAPATCKRNKTNGIIDGLWGTPMVKVQQSGFLEAGDFPGDHAAMWADISFESVLGETPQTPQSLNARRLRLFDSIATAKYLRQYGKYISESRFHERVLAFERQLIPGQRLSPSQRKYAEKLDNERTMYMKKAERKCRKLRTGAVAFSAATSGPRKDIAFWSLAISRRKGVKVSARLWRRKKHEAGIETPTKQMTLQQLVVELNEAKCRYSEAKKSDADARLKFIETFDQKDRDRIKRREESVRMGRVAKRISGKGASKSVTTVVDRMGNEHTTKEAIDAAILPVNKAKYRAADQSPFMQELVEDFGYNGHSEAVDKVLDGSYIPPAEITAETKLLLKTMQRPQSILASDYSVTANVTVDQHKKGWKKAREKTTAGPSGLHFGMFKANATVDKLAEVDASLRNIAYSTGHVYKRWCHGTDVQILKKSKDFRIEKLRTILLLEADYNMNSKQLGRDLMWKAERDLSLSRDNYGGRKNRRAVEVSLNAMLTYNSIWARRGRAVVLSNDAKGCFDRISHMVAYICLLRLGAPRAPLTSTINTIQELRHSIRTAFGDSEQTYGGDSDVPLQGLLQGNGVAPPGWAAVSAVLVQAMQEAGFGYKAWSVITQRAIEITCFAFVDDTDLIHSIASNRPTDDLIREAQKVLTTWEGLLRATGGALAPEKSYWYLVEVIRKDGKWRYKSIDESDDELRLMDTDDNDNQHVSKRLASDTAKDALGIFINPECKMSEQVKELKTKVVAFCDAARTGGLSRGEAWYVMNASIMKTIEYPLMATTMSKSEINDIMIPLFKTMLPVCGLQKKFPRKLLYGSLNSQGCNIKDPWVLQLIEHLLAILRHGEQDNPTGDLLRENMELVQTYVGSQKPFWDIPFSEAGFMAPNGWIKHTWQAMEDFPIQLQGPTATVPHRRVNDAHIMDAVRGAQCYSESEINIINNFRMNLGATCISDLTTVTGEAISSDSWKGRVSCKRKELVDTWPKTYSPKAADKDLWQAMLKEIFLVPHSGFRKLKVPLGEWKDRQDDAWKWWSTANSTTVWERHPSKWVEWTKYGASGERFRKNGCTYGLSSFSLPSDAHRIDVRRSSSGNGIRIIRREDVSQSIKDQHMATSLYEVLQRLPMSSHWATERTISTDDASTIAAALVEGTAVAVSDGSLKNGVGTAAFIIEAADSVNKIFGHNKVPGPIDEGDSYRCELAGLYAIVLVIDSIAKYYHIAAGFCTVACDNESSLKVFQPDFVPDPKGASFDLVTAVWKIARKSPITWHAEHVKGHQDVKGRELTRLEQLNVQMDTTAKEFWKYLVLDNDESMEPVAHAIHEEGWSLWSGDTKIIRPSRNHLYSILQDPITVDFWVRHERVSAIAVDLINWHNNGKALRKTPLGIRRWTTKHASHNCGCGTTLLKWKKQKDDECPRCGEREDTDHVLRCNVEGADEQWTTSMMEVDKLMNKLDTDPNIADAIRMGLTTWRKAEEFPDDECDEEMIEAIQDQSTIGWRNMMEGLWSKRWQHLQQRYYNRTESRKSGKKWALLVSRQIRLAAFTQWMHRNDVKHNTLRPRHTKMENDLHRQIASELLKGSGNLPESDHHHFEFNFADLIQRQTAYKQAWIANVTKARLRNERRIRDDEEYTNISKARSRLLAWSKTGRAT